MSELSFGSRVGRALSKLQAIDDAERFELEQSPASIRSKYEKKREALLGELDPSIRAAVVAAAAASTVATGG